MLSRYDWSDALAQCEALMIAPSGFGRRYCGDPRILYDLARGRKPGEAMQRKLVEGFRQEAMARKKRRG